MSETSTASAPSKSPSHVYPFGGASTEGGAGLADVLGGKGASLAEMSHLGLPVPPGFTISTAVCKAYYDDGETLPSQLMASVHQALAEVEATTGKKFGDRDQPLLLAVRSGARASMPGMLDTILDLGLNDETVLGLAKGAGDERFAYDTYRRFIQMFGDVVLGVDHYVFEDILETYRNLNGFAREVDLQAVDWKDVIGQYKAAIEEQTGEAFPSETKAQLRLAIEAVLRSWKSPHAVTFRRLHGIDDDFGTAVIVQAMVFGNMDETSATGVAFTRNPSTGAREIYGEYLANAQGEDIVSGVRTPHLLTKAAREELGAETSSLEELMPETFKELSGYFENLETHFGDMQDVEFTVEKGKVWMLQTRRGKRTAEAAIRIAVEMVDEGILTSDQAVMSIDAQSLNQLLHPTIDPAGKRDLVVKGLPASPGAAVGEVVFDPEDAEVMKAQGRQVILVRVETSPEDVAGMQASVGVLTARGGMTSHAAVVARSMGLPCVVGASALRVEVDQGRFRCGGRVFYKGDTITIDGTSGEIYGGEAPLTQPELSGNFARIVEWADKARRLRVRANADTPTDARHARAFGAEGIGLCRSEHMFFDRQRITSMREMILADDEAGRRKALDKIFPLQRSDFIELFEIMQGLPVTIRLLDPPLHEFLPRQDHALQAIAESLQIPFEDIQARVNELSEFNPMLGFRGCRLAIRYPEITEMQARAIFEATLVARRNTGQSVVPEIMIPFVMTRREFDIVRDLIRSVAQEVEARERVQLDYEIGTMIELPRSALCSDELVSGDDGSEFLSFGTNDLTQTTMGLSRDDAALILNDYARANILAKDPFVSIDQAGVGQLVQIGVERARRAAPSLKIGICGEHGGDPSSIQFFDDTGLDYVSCSPFRIPVARLAAAQSAIALAWRQGEVSVSKET
jgi:pyruvate, orthophosphate dikinase